jgi:hypothetical protein
MLEITVTHLVLLEVDLPLLAQLVAEQVLQVLLQAELLVVMVVQVVAVLLKAVLAVLQHQEKEIMVV